MQERSGGKMVGTGWQSGYGELLNLCCVKCGVWVSVDEKKRFHEFDGMPHHCSPKQARAIVPAPGGTTAGTIAARGLL